MDTRDFDYELPPELIAQEPSASRGEDRLLVLSPSGIEHRRFADLPGYLRPGDVLVLNDTRVLPARLRGRRATGGGLELLLLGLGDASGAVEALVRGKPLRPGELFHLPEGRGRVLRRIAGSRYLISIEFRKSREGDGRAGPLWGAPLLRYLELHGEMPTPPYIKKRLEAPERYQTVYAREVGSVAAPTAGLHLTPEMLASLRREGVGIAYLTLHIGLGTFAPVRSHSVEEHRMEAEYFRVPPESAELINRRTGRLVVVGTSTVRALESAAVPAEPRPRPSGPEEWGGGTTDGGRPRARVMPIEGWTELFIYPGYEFRVRPDMLLTNFHLPRSTLIMLVSALVGRERLLAAYCEAVREKYRFYSFGDAMLCIL
ncbi:MAG: tRNA preQ1(34) S-adenosylmethionine ribosyltransferase-isomerase QueA [Thermoplasmata archaeon]